MTKQEKETTVTSTKKAKETVAKKSTAKKTTATKSKKVAAKKPAVKEEAIKAEPVLTEVLTEAELPVVDTVEELTEAPCENCCGEALEKAPKKLNWFQRLFKKW